MIRKDLTDNSIQVLLDIITLATAAYAAWEVSPRSWAKQKRAVLVVGILAALLAVYYRLQVIAHAVDETNAQLSGLALDDRIMRLQEEAKAPNTIILRMLAEKREVFSSLATTGNAELDESDALQFIAEVIGGQSLPRFLRVDAVSMNPKEFEDQSTAMKNYATAIASVSSQATVARTYVLEGDLFKRVYDYYKDKASAKNRQQNAAALARDLVERDKAVEDMLIEQHLKMIADHRNQGITCHVLSREKLTPEEAANLDLLVLVRTVYENGTSRDVYLLGAQRLTSGRIKIILGDPDGVDYVPKYNVDNRSKNIKDIKSWDDTCSDLAKRATLLARFYDPQPAGG